MTETKPFDISKRLVWEVHIPAQREQSFWPNVNTDSGST